MQLVASNTTPSLPTKASRRAPSSNLQSWSKPEKKRTNLGKNESKFFYFSPSGALILFLRNVLRGGHGFEVEHTVTKTDRQGKNTSPQDTLTDACKHIQPPQTHTPVHYPATRPPMCRLIKIRWHLTSLHITLFGSAHPLNPTSLCFSFSFSQLDSVWPCRRLEKSWLLILITAACPITAL